MISVICECLPKPENERFDDVGVTYVVCMFDDATMEEAQAWAEEAMEEEHWEILSIDSVQEVTRDDYEPDSENLEYFAEAEEEGEVFVFHCSPKFPICCIEFDVVATDENEDVPPGTMGKALYWVTMDRVAPGDQNEEEESYGSFWEQAKHKEKVVTLGKEKLSAYHWRAAEVHEMTPVNAENYAEDPELLAFYEEAEEYDDCITIWCEEEEPG